MPLRRKLVLIGMGWLLLLPITTWGQQPPNPADNYPDSANREEPSRQEIIQSTRWRRLRRSFDEWLSVQNIHTAEQAAKLKAGLERRIESMTSPELEDFIYDTEERLDVLMSDKAKEARNWLSFLTLAGRQRKVAPDGEVPDVFDITVSQLRQELSQFQQRRAGRAAAQGDFNRIREQQVTAAVGQRQAQQRAQDEAKLRSRERATGAAMERQRNNTFTSPYAPRAYPSSSEMRRSMYVTPWGGVGFRRYF